MNSHVEGIAGQLFAALREMDAEATTACSYKGNLFPTGLRTYDKHRVPQIDQSPAFRPRFDTENAIADRLAELLRMHIGGLDVAVRPHITGNSEIADLRLTFPDGKRLWMEMKAVKKFDRFVPEKYVSNPSSAKHLTSATEGVAKDFRKLRALTIPVAHFVSVLVIGFDVANHRRFAISDSEIELMRVNAGISEEDWDLAYDEWPDLHQLGDKRGDIGDSFRVRCWLWWKELRPAV